MKLSPPTTLSERYHGSVKVTPWEYEGLSDQDSGDIELPHILKLTTAQKGAATPHTQKAENNQCQRAASLHNAETNMNIHLTTGRDHEAHFKYSAAEEAKIPAPPDTLPIPQLGDMRRLAASLS